MSALASRVRDAVASACLAELEALKPGNVHIYSDGHGMTVEDFRNSAAEVANVLGMPGLTVGERIYGAIEATHAAVGCNTNLGIVLLSAPIAHAALRGDVGAGLEAGVKRVLGVLDVADAELAYGAIRLAAPAGLGSSACHDVNERPTVTLLEAMIEARDTDRIARQYATGFEDVFGFGATRLEQARVCWEGEDWVVASLYLGFLGRFPDTHVEREHGAEAAEAVRRRGAVLDGKFLQCRRPSDMRNALMEFDAELKAAGRNPGTSADLTVASLLAASLADFGDGGTG